MNKLEELEKKYKELGEEIERLKSQSAKRWRADEDTSFYYISADGIIENTVESGWGCDDFKYDNRNYFKTYEEADKVLDKILIYNKLKDLAERLNEGKIIDWKDDNQEKFYIYFDNSEKRLDYNFHSTYQDFGTICCLDFNFLDRALKEIGEEDLMKLFEE